MGDEKDILEYKAVKEREQGTQNSGKTVLELTASKLGGVGATDAADTKEQDGAAMRKGRQLTENNGKVVGRVKKHRKEMTWMQQVRKTTEAQMAVNAIYILLLVFSPDPKFKDILKDIRK